MTAAAAARARRTSLKERIARRCERFADTLRGHTYDFDRNGERRLIERLAQIAPKLVLDVGANVGDWSAMAASCFSEARIHTFEIVPETSARLRERLADQRFTHNAFGLSDETGETSIKLYGDVSALSTMLARSSFWDGMLPMRIISGAVRTGDAYCEMSGIESIDVLKIDVEGVEHKVVRGFDRMLTEGAIRCVQFEYGYANGDAHFLMRDFYEMFEAYGYRVGRVGPDGLDMSGWRYDRNDFRSGPNYAAMRADDDELVDLLAAS